MNSQKLRLNGGETTIPALLSLSIGPLVRIFKRQRLKGELKRLRMHEAYFQWQQANGIAGLADTHKRMALKQSDLNALAKDSHG